MSACQANSKLNDRVSSFVFNVRGNDGLKGAVDVQRVTGERWALRKMLMGLRWWSRDESGERGRMQERSGVFVRFSHARRRVRGMAMIDDGNRPMLWNLNVVCRASSFTAFFRRVKHSNSS